MPWYTYPAIRFLEARIPPTAFVFEYGMGNSTLWWSARAGKIECCEHDREWFDRLTPKLPTNATAHFCALSSGDYVSAATRTVSDIDILVIDGRKRVSCAEQSLARMTANGVVIWDNSERDYYKRGFEFLARNGFCGRLDFWGMGPINTYEWCTSIFYRRENCLGI